MNGNVMHHDIHAEVPVEFTNGNSESTEHMGDAVGAGLTNGAPDTSSFADSISETTTIVTKSDVNAARNVDTPIDLAPPQIVVTEEDGVTTQTLATDSNDTAHTFPDEPVISDAESSTPVEVSDHHTSHVAVTAPDVASDNAADQIQLTKSFDENGQVPVGSFNEQNNSSLTLELGSNSSGSNADNFSTPTSPTSPKSPSKKKSFWSRLSIIFKPWKWRRKKRSKNLEQKAVGMFLF